MEETILRNEVLEAIDTGEPFDMVFITADRRRGTGGSIKQVSGWEKIKMDGTQERMPGHFTGRTIIKSKNPSHSENKTINIYNPSNLGDHVIKVHWRLMSFFNGKRILQ